MFCIWNYNETGLFEKLFLSKRGFCLPISKRSGESRAPWTVLLHLNRTISSNGITSPVLKNLSILEQECKMTIVLRYCIPDYNYCKTLNVIFSYVKTTWFVALATVWDIGLVQDFSVLPEEKVDHFPSLNFTIGLSTLLQLD